MIVRAAVAVILSVLAFFSYAGEQEDVTRSLKKKSAEKNIVYAELTTDFGCAMVKPNPLRKFIVWAGVGTGIEWESVVKCLNNFPTTTDKKGNKVPVFSEAREPFIFDRALQVQNLNKAIGCTIYETEGAPTIHEIVFHRIDGPFEKIFAEGVEQCFTRESENQ